MRDRVETRPIHASLVQDAWLGPGARLRGRRFAPFEEGEVRVLFQPDRGATLDDPPLAAFLEAVGARLDVFAFEPRGQGASSGRFGPEVVDDLRSALDAAGRRFGDDLPLVVAGHGFGGTLALAVADHPGVRGAAALAPLLAPLLDDPQAQAVVERLDLERRLPALELPLLLVAARDDARENQGAVAALAASNPRAALLAVPGDRLAPLAPPWLHLLSDWAAWAVGR